MPSPFQLVPLSARFSIAVLITLTGFASTLRASQEVPTIRGINNSLGFREHRPGMWSYVNPEIKNPLDEGVQLEVVAFFGCLQNNKFAKRVYVPPKSVLRVSLPVRIPSFDQIPLNEATGNPDELLTIQVHLYDVSGDEPTLLLNNGKRSYDTSIKTRVARFGQTGDKYRSSAMFNPAIVESEKKLTDAEDLVAAARIFFMQEGAVGISNTKYLPESMRAFDSIDQLIIHNDHLLHDSGGMSSVRRWLARGGHLWIMLDSVSEETVGRILGDSVPFELIDRTSINNVLIKDADLNSQAAEPKQVYFEEPIDFVRVVLEQGELTHTQDGWPAAFWLRSGKGRVLFTTLGAHAWMRNRHQRFAGFQEENTFDGRLGQTDYTLTDPMEQLAFEVYGQEQSETAFDNESLKTNLINQVGYQVLGRNTVIAILSIYIVTLFAAGVWMAKRKSLDKLFYVGPGLAVLTAIVFYFIGLSNKRAAEPSVASFQFVRAMPGGNEFQVDGMTIIYSHEEQEFEIAGSNDGELLRHSQQDNQSEKKIVWTHDGSWSNPKQTIEPGLVSFDVTSNVTADSPLYAKATFLENGLVGEVSSPDNMALEDLVLALSSGNYFSVDLDDQGKFLVTNDNLLANNRFVESNLLTDKQRWHQSIYESYFPANDWKRWVKRSTVFGWTNPLKIDIGFPKDFKRVGGALLKVPFEISNSPPGTKVKIPAEFIEVTNAINANNALSPCFDNKSKKWVGSTAKESSTRLRFQIPEQTLPLKVESIVLAISNVSGLDRIIEIKTVVGNAGTVVASFDNETGPYSKTLTEPGILQLDERGGFVLDIDVQVKDDFYERQKEMEESGELNPDGTKKKLVLEREGLDEIKVIVTGTVQKRAASEDAN